MEGVFQGSILQDGDARYYCSCWMGSLELFGKGVSSRIIIFSFMFHMMWRELFPYYLNIVCVFMRFHSNNNIL